MRGNRCLSLETAQTFFVTTNKALAYACKNFDRNIGKKEAIAPCITDIFLGTILWFQDPIRYDKLKESQIIASCYAAIRPNSVMINKFSKEVDRLKEYNQITSEDYTLLKDYEVLKSMLSDKVMGNIDNINEDITYEILNDLKIELRRDLEKKLEEEKQKTKKIEEEKNSIQQKNNKTMEIIRKDAKKRAKLKTIITSILMLLLPIIMIILDLVFNIMDFLRLDNIIIIIFRIVTYSIISLLSLLSIIKQFKDLPEIEKKEYTKICSKYEIES